MPTSPSRNPASDEAHNGGDGLQGKVGTVGSSGKAGSVNANYWYEKLPLKAHYSFAISNDDIGKMQEWINAGFSADTRITPEFPSAIERAISHRSVEIVRMLTENPRISSRPNPRLKVTVCSGAKGRIDLNIYEYIVYAAAISSSSMDCDPDQFFSEKAKQNKDLYVFDFSLEMFALIASIDNANGAFEADTRDILSSLKKSIYTKQGLDTNQKLVTLIESKSLFQGHAESHQTKDDIESPTAPTASGAQ